MAEHPNVELVRRGLAGIADGDFAAMEALLADDVVWHEIGRAEPLRGKDGLRAMATGAGGYAVTATTHDVVGNDEHVVALVNATATRDGRTLEYRTAEIFHLRDGKVTERWAFSDDTAAIEAFFA